MSEQEQHARELLVKELGFELFDDPNYPSGPMRMIGVRLLRNRLASKDEAVMWKLLLKRESELSSLRAEVERLRTTVEEREKLLDRFTANNIKLNQELEKLRTTVTALRGDHNHETCAHDLTYWYRFHGDCCPGCGENLHLIHPLVNLYPHFTGACKAALSEARKEA